MLGWWPGLVDSVIVGLNCDGHRTRADSLVREVLERSLEQIGEQPLIGRAYAVIGGMGFVQHLVAAPITDQPVAPGC
jgi:hypothetical protein